VGVQCITAGEAIVSIRARRGGADPEWIRLHLVGGSAPDSEATAHVGGYRVSLLGLDPAPAAGIRTDSTDYAATLLVTARPPARSR
jgi:hypothetical protein